MIATVTSGAGRPAEDEPLAWRREPSARKWSARRHHRDHHRRLGLAEQLGHHRPDPGRAPPPAGPPTSAPRRTRSTAATTRSVVVEARRGRAPCRSASAAGRCGSPGAARRAPRKPPTSGVRMITTSPPSASTGKHSTPGGVGQRRQREVDRPAVERVAHQRQRRHRLEVGAGEHHALGPAGGAAGADDHRQVVAPGGRARPAAPVGVAAAPRNSLPGRAPRRRLAVEADQRVQLRAARRGSASTSGANDAWKISARAVEQVEQLAVLGRLVARVDRAPHRAGPADPEDAGERDRVVGRQDRHLVARARRPRRDQGRGDPRATASCTSAYDSVLRRPWSGRARPGPSDGALVEVVDQPHRLAPSVLDGQHAAPRPGRSCAARRAARGARRPGSPRRSPTRRGGCCSSEYAA